jgi:hypothetical protein
MKRKKQQLFEVEIKSKALLTEGKKGLITYFQGGQKRHIVKNVMALYPQYTKPEDSPVVNITPISNDEYQKRLAGKDIQQNQQLVSEKGDIL